MSLLYRPRQWLVLWLAVLAEVATKVAIVDAPEGVVDLRYGEVEETDPSPHYHCTPLLSCHPRHPGHD